MHRGVCTRFIVSLEGVTENDQPSTQMGTGITTDTIMGTGANGRKRKLLKPFKPPSRTAPAAPSIPATDTRDSRDAENVAGNRTIPREEEGTRRLRGTLESQSIYNGFGHVASLWDEAENEDIDNASVAGGSSDQYEYEGRDRFYGGELTSVDPSSRATVQAMQLSVAATSLFQDMQEGGYGKSDKSIPDSSSFLSGMSQQQHQLAMRKRGDVQHALSNEYPDDGVNHPQNCADSRRGSDFCHGKLKRAKTENGDGRREAFEEEKILETGMSAGDSHQSVDGADVYPSARDNSNHSTGLNGQLATHSQSRSSDVGETHTRSTQDILSLFGDTQQIPSEVSLRSTEVGETHASSRSCSQNGGEQPARRLPQDSQLTGLQPSDGEIVHSGASRAAEMTNSHVDIDAQCSAIRSPNREPPAVTNHPPPAVAWTCTICGIQAAASATSCRVCGVKLHKPEEGRDNDGTARALEKFHKTGAATNFRRSQLPRSDGILYSKHLGEETPKCKGSLVNYDDNRGVADEHAVEIPSLADYFGGLQ